MPIKYKRPKRIPSFIRNVESDIFKNPSPDYSEYEETHSNSLLRRKIISSGTGRHKNSRYSFKDYDLNSSGRYLLADQTNLLGKIRRFSQNLRNNSRKSSEISENSSENEPEEEPNNREEFGRTIRTPAFISHLKTPKQTLRMMKSQNPCLYTIGMTSVLLLTFGCFIMLAILVTQNASEVDDDSISKGFFEGKLGGHEYGFSNTGVPIDQDGQCLTTSSNLSGFYPELQEYSASESSQQRADLWSGRRYKRATANDDDLNERTSRIVGGAKTHIEEFPWQVSLQSGGAHICGGSIILNDWILTAAHCTDVFHEPEDWICYAGLDRSSMLDGGQKRAIKQIVQHPGFNANDFDNDVSLLKLKSPLEYNDQIQPICIPILDTYYNPDLVTCFVSGYGTIYAGGPQSDALNSVQMPIVENEICNKWLYQSTGGTADNWVYDNMMCAGYEQGKLDGCQGDSGGPLQCVENVGSEYEFREELWYLSGAVSWGIGCAEAKKPGVYARIGYFRDWIWESIEQVQQA